MLEFYATLILKNVDQLSYLKFKFHKPIIGNIKLKNFYNKDTQNVKSKKIILYSIYNSNRLDYLEATPYLRRGFVAHYFLLIVNTVGDIG